MDNRKALEKHYKRNVTITTLYGFSELCFEMQLMILIMMIFIPSTKFSYFLITISVFIVIISIFYLLLEIINLISKSVIYKYVTLSEDSFEFDKKIIRYDAVKKIYLDRGLISKAGNSPARLIIILNDYHGSMIFIEKPSIALTRALKKKCVNSKFSTNYKQFLILLCVFGALGLIAGIIIMCSSH